MMTGQKNQGVFTPCQVIGNDNTETGKTAAGSELLALAGEIDRLVVCLALFFGRM